MEKYLDKIIKQLNADLKLCYEKVSGNHPKEFLDVLFSGNLKLRKKYENCDYRYTEFRKSLLKSISKELLKIYCNKGENANYVKNLNPNIPTLYRGLYDTSAKEYVQLLKGGVWEFHRSGWYGEGNYYSIKKEDALLYGNNNEENIVTANLKNFNSIISHEDLKKYVFEFQKSFWQSSDDFELKLSMLASESGILASPMAGALGYDAISEHGYDIICVVNPKALDILEK